MYSTEIAAYMWSTGKNLGKSSAEQCSDKQVLGSRPRSHRGEHILRPITMADGMNTTGADDAARAALQRARRKLAARRRGLPGVSAKLGLPLSLWPTQHHTTERMVPAVVQRRAHDSHGHAQL